MNDLDKQLKELDLEFLHGVPVHLNDVMIEQIKQAFTDAGYTRTPKIDQTTTSITVPRIGGKSLEFMTGQEWYDKFNDWFDVLNTTQAGNSMTELGKWLEAAKRAAGLEV